MATGSGTETDPYIVSSYTELVDGCNQSRFITKSYVTFPDNCVIECDKEYPNGVPSIAANVYILGNGVIFKNLYGVNKSYLFVGGSTGQCHITDATFENIHLKNVGAMFCRNGSTYVNVLTRCKLNGLLDNSSLFMSGNATTTGSSASNKYDIYLRRVGINVELLNNSHIVHPYSSAVNPVYDTTGWQYILDSHITINGGGNNATSLLASKLRDCYIDGKLPEGSSISVCNSNAEESWNTVIDVSADSTNKIKGTTTFDTRPSYLSAAINEDRIGESTKYDNTFRYVTTDNLNDPSYMKSIGFPCGE